MALEIADVLDQFNADWDADETNRDEAAEDMRFCRGGEYQWPSAVVADRKAKGRPIITVNQIPKFVRQVSGDIRQSQPAIECYPVDDQTDPILSDIFEGAVRQIEYQSGAQSIYSHAAECAIMAGIGHFRIVTDYADDSAFDQDIFIKRILDPLAVIWDGNANEIDRSDAGHCFVTEMVAERDFKARYPKASLASFDDGVRTQGHTDWIDGDFIRIAEYWVKEPVDVLLGMTQDGQTVRLDKVHPDMIPMLGIVRERKAKSHKVCRYVVNGSEVLEEKQDWAGKHIPIIPVMGSEMSINGEVVRKSLIRDAKAPQQLYNFWRSHAAESIALAPKAPWLVEAENIKGHESFWNNANKDNIPYLPFTSAESGFVPVRNQPAAPPAAMWQEAKVAADDMQATTGIFDASLGQRSNETSGRAIIARQREGDVGSFVFIDNFNQAIRRAGQVLIDLIPKIYDSQRIIRVMSNDQKQEFVPVNHVVMDTDGQETVINDLSTARFDVRIKTGPSYSTSREEAKEQLGQLLQSSPDLMQIIGDIYFDNLDFNGADKIADRMRKILPPQLQEQDPDDPNAVQQPDPTAQAAERLQMADAEVKIAKTQAETGKIIAETEQTEVETELKAFETGMNAGINGQ
ncbi:MAG: hypothetical protein GY807_21035 [Gammaproteobacteria bacterium]|nr:hypothetical protein [Gammaproteobacteria bacterium]